MRRHRRTGGDHTAESHTAGQLLNATSSMPSPAFTVVQQPFRGVVPALDAPLQRLALYLRSALRRRLSPRRARPHAPTRPGSDGLRDGQSMDTLNVLAQ